jgi:Protein of unknown function (DUF3099)
VRSDRKRTSVLITDAAEDPEKELRHREIRYVIMMTIRALCLVLGAVVVTTKPPLWPLWLVLLVVGMVLLPWLAVVLANDGPPKTRAERAASARKHSQEPPALTSYGPDWVIDAEFEPTAGPDGTAPAVPAQEQRPRQDQG